MGGTEGSPVGLGRNFGRWNGSKITWAKMIDVEPLRALSGPEPPGPDLARFQIKVKHGILKISLYVCKNINIGTNAILSASLDNSTEPSKLA